MRHKTITASLLACALTTACVFSPSKQPTVRVVSPDYTAVGYIDDVRAYVYGDKTLLDFDSNPIGLSIKDGNGKSVDYEQVGRYIRLNRRLDVFTIWIAGGRSTTFTAPVVTKVFKAPEKQSSSPAPVPAVTQSAVENSSEIAAKMVEPVRIVAAVAVPKAGDSEILALIETSNIQLKNARKLLDAASKNPGIKGADLFSAQQRLDAAQSAMEKAGAATVFVNFSTGVTAFNPGNLGPLLVASGKSSNVVTIRGRTDARIAGALDEQIAQGRANGARQYLVAHGVKASKIHVSAKAEGDFLVPNNHEGRALNRRVEIEFTNDRIADLKLMPVKMASK